MLNQGQGRFKSSLWRLLLASHNFAVLTILSTCQRQPTESNSGSKFLRKRAVSQEMSTQVSEQSTPSRTLEEIVSSGRFQKQGYSESAFYISPTVAVLLIKILTMITLDQQNDPLRLPQ